MKLSELRNAAVKAHQDEKFEEALAHYRLYLTNMPTDYTIWSNLGALFRKMKNYRMAALAQRRALQADNPTPGTLSNAANAYYDHGWVEEALALRRTLQTLEPDEPNHWAFGAKSLRGLRRYKEANAMARAGLERWPDHIELHLQLAFGVLSEGDYVEGFAEYDWRWKGDELTYPTLPCPQWQGEDLSGKTVLAVAEQGFGDTILMARFLPQIQALGAKVCTYFKPPLQRLLQNADGIDILNSGKEKFHGIDYWVPFMDMPRFLKTSWDTLPSPTQLTIPEDSQTRAEQFLARYKDTFNIGVLWSGSTTYRANHKRSFGHEQFLSLAEIPNVQMFSLYKGPLLDDYINDGTATIIVNAAGSDRDFADSAALMKGLDLVITMDSAIAHVAGSLGVLVWNILHDNPYWLYEPFEDTTPWYPTMRLVRQAYNEPWDSVFERIKADVAPLAQATKG